MYIDIASPFGCQTSVLACARNTRVMVWLLRQEGYFSLCYLDDFVGSESSRVAEACAHFNMLAADLGLQLVAEKCTPPATTATWLGFEVKTVEMSIILYSEKLDEVLNDCKTWAVRKTASRKQLHRLAGKLQHGTKTGDKIYEQGASRFKSHSV